ncbi:MAG: N-acetyltransferase [Bacillota bacterium]|nr:N-acetyltransferase [Bacillota bacterium]
MEIKIRPEQVSEQREVEELTREAFWNVYMPGCDEHYLLHILRTSECFLPELNMVAEVEGKIVGHIAYTKAKIVLNDGGERVVIGFGPLSVLPEYQRQGVGSALIRHTLELAKDAGYAAVLIYGNPAYYHRFGFVPAQNFGIASAEGSYVDALQALELREGALAGCSGRLIIAEEFELDPKAAELFDQSFPPKERRTD